MMKRIVNAILTPWIWPKKTQSDKMVLLSIAQGLNDGVSCLSTIGLALECGLSKQAVINSIKRLKGSGWISVEKRGQSRYYSINLQEVEKNI